MKKLLLASAFCLAFTLPLSAQNVRPIGPNAPCTAFGTAAATCAQGNDSRITGAAQQTGPTAWTPGDGSGAALVFTGVSANYTILGNMIFAYGALTYPTTVDASAAKINGLPVNTANASYARQCTINTSTVSTAVYLLPTQNSAIMSVVSAAGAPVLNSTMTGGSLWFMCIYPGT